MYSGLYSLGWKEEPDYKRSKGKLGMKWQWLHDCTFIKLYWVNFEAVNFSINKIYFDNLTFFFFFFVGTGV
jgi:hypothetical protein